MSHKYVTCSFFAEQAIYLINSIIDICLLGTQVVRFMTPES